MKIITTLAVVVALSLSACATPEAVPIVTERPVTLEVPASLTARCVIPNPPAPGATQRDVAAYLLRLYGALETCAERHSGLVSVIEDFKAQIAAQENPPQ